MKTWEVKLLAGNNGVVQMNVQADGFRRYSEGVDFFAVEADGEDHDVAFFPMGPLLSIKDVSP